MSASTECTSIYKEGRKLLSQCNKFQSKFELLALELSHTKARQQALMAPTNVGRLKAMHDVGPIMTEAKEFMLKAADLEKRKE
jgi:hypothetical protein